jgi:hypothetical protein
MGQYYHPIILDTDRKTIKKWWHSHDFREDGSSIGLKLMEHSYVGNWLMQSVESELFRNAQNVVWAGDYADPEPDPVVNRFNVESSSSEQPAHNLYDMTEHAPKAKPVPYDESKEESHRYLVNHTKKIYVDKTKLDSFTFPNYPDDPHIYHPLSLLTAEGNGRGGGDYHGTCEEVVGTWARDLISVEDNIGDYKDFKEIPVVFEYGG